MPTYTDQIGKKYNFMDTLDGYKAQRELAAKEHRPAEHKDLPAANRKGVQMIEVNMAAVPFSYYMKVGNLLASLKAAGFILETENYSGAIKVYGIPSKQELDDLLADAQTEFDFCGEQYDLRIGKPKNNDEYELNRRLEIYSDKLGVPRPWNIVLPTEEDVEKLTTLAQSMEQALNDVHTPGQQINFYRQNDREAHATYSATLQVVGREEFGAHKSPCPDCNDSGYLSNLDGSDVGPCPCPAGTPDSTVAVEIPDVDNAVF